MLMKQSIRREMPSAKEIARMSSDTTKPAPALVPTPERRTRSMAELAAEQGVIGPQDFDALFGAGADLWPNDADFEAYLVSLRESRQTGG
jgi:hypothetical protein